MLADVVGFHISGVFSVSINRFVNEYFLPSISIYFTQGSYKNDLIGLEFDPMIPGDPKLKGKDVITQMYRMPIDHSKWWDLAALVLLLILYRVLFFMILKFKEGASPLFHVLYSKRALHHLDKRPSFRKKPTSPSKRHDSLLSSQEGLNSPLQ